MRIVTKYENTGYAKELLILFSEQNRKQIGYIYHHSTLDTNIETINWHPVIKPFLKKIQIFV